MVQLRAVSGALQTQNYLLRVIVAGSGFRGREEDVGGLPIALRFERVGFQDSTGVAEGTLAFSERRSRL